MAKKSYLRCQVLHLSPSLTPRHSCLFPHTCLILYSALVNELCCLISRVDILPGADTTLVDNWRVITCSVSLMLTNQFLGRISLSITHSNSVSGTTIVECRMAPQTDRDQCSGRAADGCGVLAGTKTSTQQGTLQSSTAVWGEALTGVLEQVSDSIAAHHHITALHHCITAFASLHCITALHHCTSPASLLHHITASHYCITALYRLSSLHLDCITALQH